MALVFRNSPEAPVQCALELSRADKKNLNLQLRMGIHSGPINEITDVNDVLVCAKCVGISTYSVGFG